MIFYCIWRYMYVHFNSGIIHIFFFEIFTCVYLFCASLNDNHFLTKSFRIYGIISYFEIVSFMILGWRFSVFFLHIHISYVCSILFESYQSGFLWKLKSHGKYNYFLIFFVLLSKLNVGKISRFRYHDDVEHLAISFG